MIRTRQARRHDFGAPARPKQLDLFDQRPTPKAAPRILPRPKASPLGLLTKASFIDLTPAEMAQIDAELDRLGVCRGSKMLSL